MCIMCKLSKLSIPERMDAIAELREEIAQMVYDNYGLDRKTVLQFGQELIPLMDALQEKFKLPSLAVATMALHYFDIIVLSETKHAREIEVN